MPRRKQLTNVIEQIVSTGEVDKVEESIIKDYEELKEKCDSLITKIKSRKKKGKKTKSVIVPEVK